MQFTSKARFVRFSPYKLRPLADVVRGKSVSYALAWLSTCALQRAVFIKKMVESAAANAKDIGNIEIKHLMVSEIRVDEGPSFRYFKPGAMGRSNNYKKRTSHMSIILESVSSTNKKGV